MSSSSSAIGIDLGTTYSCVGVWQQGKVEIIANSQGNHTTASYVAFTETGRLIGDAAKSQATLNPKNTIFDAKRLLGRRFDDEVIKEDMKFYPFTLVSDASRPRYRVKFRGQTKIFSPEEISAMVLTELKNTAETYLGTSVRDCVITVPAYFNGSQRQATRDACTIAGLNVLRMMSEPAAAALAYGLGKNLKGKLNVLIFDLGGGTLDVSVLRISEGSVFQVLSTAGNPHLGGEDFDNRLIIYLKELFKREYGKDISGDLRALRRLRAGAERAKRALSNATETTIELDSFHSDIDFHAKVTRARFEELCTDLFRSTWDPVEKALVDAKLSRYDIDEVVLVGGSTRIPKVQTLLQNFFHGIKPLNTSINPDEGVAYGAAVQAAILTSSALQDVQLVEVTPSSVGIEGSGGLMMPLIERNSRIPCVRLTVCTTYADNQSNVTVAVYEGENMLVKDNNLLGLMNLNGIPPARRGVPQIKVCFKLDENGILKVTATDNATGSTRRIVISNDEVRLTKSEISRMIQEAIQYREADEKERTRVAARNNLESYILAAIQNMGAAVNGLSETAKTWRVECENALNWLNDESTTYKQEDYENKLRILMDGNSLVDSTVAEDGTGGVEATGQAERHRNGKEELKIKARMNLKSCIFRMLHELEQAGNKFSENVKKSWRQECVNTLKWMDEKPMYEKEEYDNKLKMLNRTYAPLMGL